MLKPISHSKWSPALAACQKMMVKFALWLCEPGVNSRQISQAKLSTVLGTPEESEWLWNFLHRNVAEKPLLDRAKKVANLSSAEKGDLRRWILDAKSVSHHFALASTAPPLPTRPPIRNKSNWGAFKTLMEGFYSPGLTNGLPYDVLGKVTSNKDLQVNYIRFKDAFLLKHKIDQHPDARGACVICGAEISKSHIDHWISKADFPLLSICADNLIPMCDECNESPNKGWKKVHTAGSFNDWFHPYKRHPAGKFVLAVSTPPLGIDLKSTNVADKQSVENLDQVFNLKARWSKELRAEYLKVQRSLERRQAKSSAPLTILQVDEALSNWANDLSASEPNHEVHQLLFQALQDPLRLLSWHSELED